MRRSDGTSSTYYATSDHLGSADLVLDASGGVLARESFGPFGARRGSNWQGVPTTADYTTFSSTTRQGFTGQEMLDSVGLVHMNGRVYDPTLGRFLSADTVIQTLGSSQAINPYAYAWNDPLKYIDPSGHSLLGDIVGVIVAIVIIVVAPYVAGAAYGVGGASFSVTAAVAGFVGGFVGAYISTGSLSAALTAGLIAGITAFAFAQIGGYAAQMEQRGSEWAKPFSVLAHAAVGCAGGVASGGNCGRGALAAGISDAAVRVGLIKPEAVGVWGKFKNAAEAGLVGGVAARITGGKFDDGFTVSAAGYLFNSAAHAIVRETRPGITSDGSTLTGSIPYSCGGTTADCNQVISQLNQFADANGFDLSFHPASLWERVVGFFDSSVLDIQFRDALPTVDGKRIVGTEFLGRITLYGTDWAASPVIADHEFGHFLGLGHDEPPWGIGQLMYPTALSGVSNSIVLFPADRQALIRTYSGAQ